MDYLEELGETPIKLKPEEDPLMIQGLDDMNFKKNPSRELVNEFVQLVTAM